MIVVLKPVEPERFIEPITKSDQDAILAAWDEIMPEEFHGLLDAEVRRDRVQQQG